MSDNLARVQMWITPIKKNPRAVDPILTAPLCDELIWWKLSYKLFPLVSVECEYHVLTILVEKFCHIHAIHTNEVSLNGVIFWIVECEVKVVVADVMVFIKRAFVFEDEYFEWYEFHEFRVLVCIYYIMLYYIHHRKVASKLQHTSTRNGVFVCLFTSHLPIQTKYPSLYRFPDVGKMILDN